MSMKKLKDLYFQARDVEGVMLNTDKMKFILINLKIQIHVKHGEVKVHLLIISNLFRRNDIVNPLVKL